MKDEQEDNIYKAKSGDKRAYNLLVRQWHPKIYNFAYKYFSGKSRQVIPHDLAMEVSQKTFISVYRNLSKLEDTQKFSSWLFRIAINYCYEEDRKHKRKSVFSFMEMGRHSEANMRDSFEGQSAGPYATTHHKNCKDWIYQALKQIPEEQRTVVIMKEFEGLKFKEIAETLKLSENTVKSRMYYGLNALRKVFDSWNLDKESMLYE